ncbi:MAG: DUF4276 family protein [Alphaproteobacteria bacterium]|nr:DUF4276 family protein [Alphaproteobacteria bacterium]
MTFRLISILAEGKTEQVFVTHCLRPHFERQGVRLKVTLARPGRRADSSGGVQNYDAIRADILSLLSEPGKPIVTTMIDYYRRPSNMPGNESVSNSSSAELVSYLEGKWRDDIGYPQRFIPYYSLHEFEALLFSNTKIVSTFFPGHDAANDLEQIVKQVSSPENINETPEGAPSKRLEKLLRYKKALHGPQIANKIGLSDIRKTCPHFNEWLSRLEALR